MKAIIIATAVLAAVSFARSAEIQGDIFIVLKSQAAVKLPLVQVGLFEEKAMRDHIAVRISERAKVLDFFKSQGSIDDADVCIRLLGRDFLQTRSPTHAAEKIASYPLSAEWYLSELPPALAVTKTDADGKFRFEIPDGTYCLVAIASRDLPGDKTETYHWIVKAKPGAGVIHLANDNLSDTRSDESMIYTFDDKENRADAMVGRDRAWLLNFVEQRKLAIPREKEIADAEAARVAAREGSATQQRLQNLAASTAALRTQAYAADPKLAHRHAVEKFPALGVAGSPLNKEFVARAQTYKATKPAFFANPAWPVLLAEECSSGIAEKLSGVASK